MTIMAQYALIRYGKTQRPSETFETLLTAYLWLIRTIRVTIPEQDRS